MKLSIPHPDGTYMIPAILEPSGMSERNGLVVLVHGLTTDKHEYLHFYDKMSAALTQQGYDCLRIDNRCHGASSADPLDFTIANITQDIVVAIEWYKKETPEFCAPIRIVGTSFGAPSSIIIAANELVDVEKLILICPVSDYRSLYIKPIDSSRAQRYAGLIERTFIANQLFEIDDRRKIGMRLAFEFMSIDLLSLFTRVNCPTIVFHGTEDGLVPVTLSRELVKKNAKSKLVELPKTEHGFTEVGDETGNSEISSDNFLKMVGAIGS